MKHGLGLFFITAAAALVFSDVRPAEACGGCFVPPAENTVVTDHRMALSISPQQTVLWDQIRYSGDPAEFAWVLPVRPGARIEVSNDEFFTALDASSQPVVYPPNGNMTPLNCGLTGCASDEASSARDGSGDDGVEVLGQSVVGPYDTVTLRATDEDALTTWLRKNAFTIPPSIEPTIQAYVGEGFDFIALKLRPACGERAMKPVRVISPGATPTLPLRMVAAGVGPQVGIILYVITEGKYQPQNFPHAFFDDEKLRWNSLTNKSNYEELSQQIMGRESNRTWLTEYADKPQIPLIGTGWQRPSQRTPLNTSGGFIQRTQRGQNGLADQYFGRCKYLGTSAIGSSSSSSGFGGFGGSSSSSSSSSGSVVFTPCPQGQQDAGTQSRPPFDAGNQGPVDAGNDASVDASVDAGVDAGGQGGQDDDDDDSAPFPLPPPNPNRDQGTGDLTKDCAYLDDLDVALSGLNRENVWVTRLRSQLPSSVLTGGDLVVEPAKLPDGRADTEVVSNLHWAQYFEGEQPPESTKGRCDSTPRSRALRRHSGGWAVVSALAFVAFAWIRRRRRG